ncbi:MAG: serine protease, partial [Microbacteriaceae bacterium]|nr:serine protease [Microbacteriaceae bacterium]
MPGTILLDLLLLVFLLGYAFYGFRRGFALTAGSIVGVIAGAVAAFFAIPLVAGWVPNGFARVPLVLISVGVLVGAGFAIGAAIGRAIRTGVGKSPLRVVDRVLGSVLSVIATAIVISMLAFGISSLGVPFLSPAIAGSRVVATIDSITPPPVRALEAQVRSAVFAQGIPRLLDTIGAGS